MTNKTNVKTGNAGSNRNETKPSGLRVLTAVKAGWTLENVLISSFSDGSSRGCLNHNQTGIAVRTKVKAGRIATNHNQTAPQAA